MSSIGVVDITKYSRDVELVKKYARCCIYINPHSTTDKVRVVENPNFRVEVLAVIGPYKSEALNLPEAVLLEVGLFRCKPYVQAEGLKHNRDGYPTNYARRHTHLSITTEQYQLVAPEIFKFLQSYAFDRVSAWKSNWFDPWWVKVHVGSHKNRLSGLTTEYKWYPAKRSVRFAISTHDELLASDVYWTELFGIDNLHEELKKLIIYMQVRFGGFKQNGRKFVPKSWMVYPRFAAAVTALKRLPYYLQVFIWKKHFPPHHYFHYEIMEEIKYEGAELWEERILNMALPDPISRVGDVSLRIVRRTEKYVVFEITPPAPEQKNGNGNYEYEDEIPF